MISNKITTGMDTKVKLSGSDRGSLVADPTEGETTMNSPKRLARIAGVLYLLVVGGVCYLVDLLAAFLVPDFGQNIHTFVVIPSAIAEISMVLYLLVIGVRTVKPGERILAAE